MKSRFDKCARLLGCITLEKKRAVIRTPEVRGERWRDVEDGRRKEKEKIAREMKSI